MNIRAILFDVYGTLLEVGPSPPDADESWHALWWDLLGLEPPLSRLGFSVASSKVIARHHEAARRCGVPWPEVHWPSVVAEVIPELAQLSPNDRDEFLFRQIQTGHTTQLTAETAVTLRGLKGQDVLLGLASNAQPYTLRELQESLAARDLDLDLFERDLCYWSFEHGFSKPDPHVFRILTTRLAARGVQPRETLMVGDRLDNDVAPARMHGWQAWQLGSERDGDWTKLHDWLRVHTKALP